MELIGLLKGSERDLSILDILEGSSYDDQIDIDVENDTYKINYHVNDKYYVPTVNMSHSEMYRFTLNNLIHPEDREKFKEIANPYTLLQRIGAAEKNIISGQYRYRDKNGIYRWTEEVIIGGVDNGIEEGIVKVFLF